MFFQSHAFRSSIHRCICFICVQNGSAVTLSLNAVPASLKGEDLLERSGLWNATVDFLRAWQDNDESSDVMAGLCQRKVWH